MAIILNSFTPSTTIESEKVNENFSDLQTVINNMRPTLYVQRPGVLATSTDLLPPIEIAQALTMTECLLNITTAPTGAAVIVNIKVNGTTVFSTKPQIDAGSTSGGGDAVFSTTALSDGDIITFAIDQVGSTVTGSNLTIGIVCRY
jgi:hypothetical protein